MLFYIIPFAIIVICIIVILIILFKKFPELAAIDINTIQKEKELMMKEQIMAERLKRKVAYLGRIFSVVALPLKVRGKKLLSKTWHKLVELEEHYRKKEKEFVAKKDPGKLGEGARDLLAKADSEREAGDYEAAEKNYIEVLSMDKTDTDAYRGLATIYYDRKDYTHAKQVLEHLLKIDSLDEQAYSFLGLIARQQGNLKEAERNYLDCLSINSKGADHYFDLGEVYVSMSALDKAIQCFAKALDIEPNNPRYLDILLETSIMSKDKELAKKVYYRLKKVNPENQKLDEFKKKIRDIK